MDADAGKARRYCSVCGYLSSEPSATCPHCTLSTARVPQIAPAPVPYAREPSPERVAQGPPAWMVIGAILVIAVITILAVLAWDGVFSSPSSNGALVDGARWALGSALARGP